MWSAVMWSELTWFVWSDFVLKCSEVMWCAVMWSELTWFVWSDFALKWGAVMCSELTWFVWSDFVLKWSEVRWCGVNWRVAVFFLPGNSPAFELEFWIWIWINSQLGMKYLPAYEDGTVSVPKRRHIKFRRRVITEKKAHNIQNRAEIWNHVRFYIPNRPIQFQLLYRKFT